MNDRDLILQETLAVEAALQDRDGAVMASANAAPDADTKNNIIRSWGVLLRDAHTNSVNAGNQILAADDAAVVAAEQATSGAAAAAAAALQDLDNIQNTLQNLSKIIGGVTTAIARL